MKSSLTRKAISVFLTLSLVICLCVAVPNAANNIVISNDVVISGHFGKVAIPTYINGDVTVTEAGLRLNNLIIDGDLIISADRVPGGGTCYLNNVTVSGDIIVTGNAPVQLKGTADWVVLEDGGRFTLASGAVGVVYVSGGASCDIRVLKDTYVAKAIIETDATVRGEGTIDMCMVAMYKNILVAPGIVTQ